jgi:hypothetical protein
MIVVCGLCEIVVMCDRLLTAISINNAMMTNAIDIIIIDISGGKCVLLLKYWLR